MPMMWTGERGAVLRAYNVPAYDPRLNGLGLFRRTLRRLGDWMRG
jgi:hypothetical protein